MNRSVRGTVMLVRGLTAAIVATSVLGFLSCGSGAAAPSQECLALEGTMAAAIAAGRACSVEADCLTVSSDCLTSGRPDCTGTFPVNKAFDAVGFAAWDRALSACMPAERCGSCPMSLAPASRCVQGLCTSPAASPP